MEVILQLQRNGVQVILTTHNNILLRYFELNRQKSDSVEFLNLQRDDVKGVTYNASKSLSKLSHVSIQEAIDQLYNVEIKSAINLGL